MLVWLEFGNGTLILIIFNLEYTDITRFQVKFVGILKAVFITEADKWILFLRYFKSWHETVSKLLSQVNNGGTHVEDYLYKCWICKSNTHKLWSHTLKNVHGFNVNTITYPLAVQEMLNVIIFVFITLMYPVTCTALHCTCCWLWLHANPDFQLTKWFGGKVHLDVFHYREWTLSKWISLTSTRFISHLHFVLHCYIYIFAYYCFAGFLW